QACEAIGEAHMLGIVHRDLKPSNLFLASRPHGTPTIKVLDFGISKSISAFPGPARSPTHGTVPMATTGKLALGSPLYMSPEQIRRTRDVDTRTDIWALGVILHELVSGRPPFEAESVVGLCAKIATEPLVGLRQLRPDVPEALESAIARCLEKDP